MRGWHKGLALLIIGAGVAGDGGRPAGAQDPAALTIYNQHFAVVRETVRLDLKKGANNVTYDRVTGLLEPDSVVLRDPTGKRSLRLLEQNYQTDAVNYQQLLARFEGKTLDFLVQRPGGGGTEIVPAKLIRAGGGNVGVSGGFGSSSDNLNYYYGSDIVEVDGKVRFGLPGTPLFPSEALEGARLRPTLALNLETDRDGRVDTELSYVTRGFTWEADYNVVSPENADTVTLTGLVTIRNTSGRTFENARIKLMAGDVSKLQPRGGVGGFGGGGGGGFGGAPAPPPVTERSFDEYHLYSLRDPTTLRHREMKQVEFARAENVRAARLYVYDGAKFDPQRADDYYSNSDPRYGVPQTNTKVWVMRSWRIRRRTA